VIRWLRENSFRLKVPQLWRDSKDEGLRQAFIRHLHTWLADEQIDLLYTDDRHSQATSPATAMGRARQEGSRDQECRSHPHERDGHGLPRTGHFYALAFNHSASWHKNRGLNCGLFKPAYIPPYSLDLNPIERLWRALKAEWFTTSLPKIATP